MLDATEARDVAVDRDVVRRVDEYDRAPSGPPGAAHRRRRSVASPHRRRWEPIAPQITEARDHAERRDRSRRSRRRDPFRASCGIADQEVDLGSLESDHFEVETEIELGELLQLDRE